MDREGTTWASASRALGKGPRLCWVRSHMAFRMLMFRRPVPGGESTLCVLCLTGLAAKTPSPRGTVYLSSNSPLRFAGVLMAGLL